MKTLYTPILIYSQNENSSYVQQMKTVIGIIPYHGCNIYPINRQFKALGKMFDSLDEAKEAIDRPITIKKIFK